MRNQLLGVILTLVGPTALSGQSLTPADLAGDWALAAELYGETDYHRTTFRAAGDQVTVSLDGMKLECRIRDGKIEVQQSGKDEPSVKMTGTVERGEMSGDLTMGTMTGRWKATRVWVRPPNAPREHVFEPKEFHRVFSGAIRPVLHIYPCDLPVSQPGALLFMGDGHAAQGDGELTGNALETSMDIEFAVDVIPGKSVAMPRAEDDEYLMAMGIAGSLTEAFQIATTQMARWLEDSYKLNAGEVASVLATAMRYDIAEVVDPYVNVVAKVPKKMLAQIQKAGG